MEKDAGVLNRSDARAWKRWWDSQPGCSARLEAIGRGLYRCYLSLSKSSLKTN